MKAFNIQNRKTSLSKKELEKQKLIEEKEAEAAVLQQFVETFEKPEAGIKTFVKGDTINGPAGDDRNSGSFDTGDPNTTNIYLGNINPKTTENDLMKVFGKYGPLASVKIMWPRTDEERSRNRNCGFVAYMNRKDAERSMKYLCGKEIMGYDMKLGWGKTVPIPPHPVYIPPKLRELTMPPPPSGLPFNAQPDVKDLDKLPPPGTMPLSVLANKENFKEILKNSIVKVVTPSDRSLLCLIHRMVEFVVREGPMFEAMIMNREISNPLFRFLFDNQSSEHIYYRWRLFSVLQGEHHSKWRTESFRMFKDGSMWKPPPLNPFSQGMPEDLIEFSPPAQVDQPIITPSPSRSFKELKDKKGVSLTDKEREIFEDLLRNLSPERQKIQDAMIYCIEHAEAAEEIIDCISESLSLLETPLHKKIARLYLISDILHNCTAKVTNASYYRKGFQAKLTDVFKNLNECYSSIEGRMKAEQFKQRIMNCFKAWKDWALYSSDFLISLQNIFLGLVKSDVSDNADLDGMPIIEDESDLDGVPLEDSESKFKLVSKWETIENSNDKKNSLDQSQDIDLDENIDGVPIDTFEVTKICSKEESSSNSLSSKSLQELDSLKQKLNFLSSEERRAKLREIEVKVLKYQDDLDKSKKKNDNVEELIEDYRKKLIKKCIQENFKKKSSRSRSRSPSKDKKR
ncbi:hypothetical protein RND71_044172 [Anisodus tanguticus]|uniref:U2 snRNP-associated SURP motif-containing protein n=1 Tax=Anisodus tanguticus TaxID=243964 RepID=A0AAE1UN79_9SOLA|nr:hypothetical protein RND71_044172 [Anisodus tanguticus]